MGVDKDTVESRLQVVSIATSASGARALADQVRLALKRFRGTVGSTVVDDVFLVNEFDRQFTDTPGVYQTLQDYMVWHRE